MTECTVEKADLLGWTSEELVAYVSGLGMKPFRGRQIYQWIYRHGVDTFTQMTDLSKSDRSMLQRMAGFEKPEMVERVTSSDGTEKFLFRLADGHRVEGVMIPDQNRRTLCVSTQVGCGMNCRFCCTGRSGLVRNLRVSEIVGQVLVVQATRLDERPLSHIVLMGMGEPLANYEATVQAVRVLLDPWGFDFSGRKITLSTCGLVPGIERLAKEGLGINLAVSLNAADDATRSRLMPINEKYPLGELMQTLRRFPLPVRRRLTVEYVLIRGVNDSQKDAAALARLLRGIRCKINLIPFNPVPGSRPGSPYEAPSRDRIEAFQNLLLGEKYTALLRESRGADIAAACGQLRERLEHGG
jgi:23S rRNA (adenine2503-C2)-methyltransferase